MAKTSYLDSFEQGKQKIQQKASKLQEIEYELDSVMTEINATLQTPKKLLIKDEHLYVCSSEFPLRLEYLQLLASFAPGPQVYPIHIQIDGVNASISDFAGFRDWLHMLLQNPNIVEKIIHD